jgi:hypothetical protein
MKKTKTRRNRRRKQTRRRKIRGGVGSAVISDDENTYTVYITNTGGPRHKDTLSPMLFEKIVGTNYWKCNWGNVVNLFNQVGQTKTEVNEYMFNLDTDHSEKENKRRILNEYMSYNDAVGVFTETNESSGKASVSGFALKEGVEGKFCVLTTEQINGGPKVNGKKIKEGLVDQL